MTPRDTTITLMVRANAAQLHQALQQAGQRTRAFGVETERAGRQAANGWTDLGKRMRGLLAAYASLRSVQALAQISDEATNLQGRLHLATTSQEAFNAAYRGVLAIAQATRQPLASTIDLYARIERSTRSLVLDQQQLLGLTQTISQAVALSFASVAGGEAAIMQLGQGLSVGVLRGQDLNSVLEQTPRLAEAIQSGLKALGVKGADNLKKIAEEGKLTTELVLRAIQTQSQAVSEEFAQLPLTIGGALTQLRNAFTVTVGETERAVGVAGAFSREIAALAVFVERYSRALEQSDTQTRQVSGASSILITIVRILGSGVIGLKVAFQIVGNAIAALIVSIQNLGRFLVLNGRLLADYFGAVRQALQGDLSGFQSLARAQQSALQEAKAMAAGTAEAWRAAGGEMSQSLESANRQIRLLWTTSADAGPAEDFAANAEKIAESARTVAADAKDAARQAKAAAAEAKRQQREREREEEKARQRRTELTDTVAQAQIALLRVSGQEVAARRAELVREYGKAITDLERLSDHAGAGIIRRLIDVETARAQLTQLQAQVDRIFGQQDREEASIQARQQAGLLHELGARRELLDLHARTAAEVERLLPLLDEAARATGDPAALERLRDLVAQVDALKQHTNELLQTWQTGLESGLSHALEGLATGASSVRDALTGLVQEITRVWAQWAAQQLAAEATARWLARFQRPSTPDLAAPDPVQAAAAGAAYATPIAGASAALGAAGGVVLSAAQAMQVAATTLMAAQSAGSAIPGFARGGFTGTGPRLAPAGIVHRGEFVHRQAVVRQPGALAFLTEFNRIGMRALDRWRGYADGGFVAPVAPRTLATPRFALTATGPGAPTSTQLAHTTRITLDVNAFKRHLKDSGFMQAEFREFVALNPTYIREQLS
jgi:tape measure domain-containing protein